MSTRITIAACVFFLALLATAVGEEAFLLRTEARVDSQGIHLDQLVDSETVLPHTLLAPAPALGKVQTLTKAQVVDLIKKAAPDLASVSITGAPSIRVMRKSRSLEESEIKEMLRATLQGTVVKERGELELRFARAWAALQVPDEPLELKILDLPVQGIAPHFIARVELRTATETIGTWSMPLQARILREIWVAKTGILRKQALESCELAREMRDVLPIREPLAQVDPADTSIEVVESVAAGAPLLARSLRVRPVVQRGKVVDAVVQDGGMSISAKVEVLEEGAPGQFIRVRNLKSKKEFRGKVQNEQTVLVSL